MGDEDEEGKGGEEEDEGEEFGYEDDCVACSLSRETNVHFSEDAGTHLSVRRSNGSFVISETKPRREKILERREENKNKKKKGKKKVKAKGEEEEGGRNRATRRKIRRMHASSRTQTRPEDVGILALLENLGLSCGDNSSKLE